MWRRALQQHRSWPLPPGPSGAIAGWRQEGRCRSPAYARYVLEASCDHVAEACANFSTVLACSNDDDWAPGTPEEDWTVPQLVNHVVATMTKFSDFAEGLTEAPGTPPGDMLAAGGITAFEAARARALNAWASVDPQRCCRLPFGEFSAAQAAAIVSFDVLLHAWDLAQVLNAPISPPSDALLAVAASVAERLVTPEAIAQGFYADPMPAPPIPGWGNLLWRTGRRSAGRA